jgi:hypothetical protein
MGEMKCVHNFSRRTVNGDIFGSLTHGQEENNVAAVSGQRLGKHVPVARQQILNNATVGLQQWKRGVSTWSVPRSYIEDNWGVPVSSVRESVKRGLESVKLKNIHC